MKTIEPAETIDKKITRIEQSWAELLVRFDDDTVLKIVAISGHEDPYLVTDRDLDAEDLVKIGLKSQEEHDAEIEAARQARLAQERSWRLKEWQRLNREFAGVEPAVPTHSCAVCDVHGAGACGGVYGK